LIHRAVITGIGAVSPNGIGRERFWKATRNGVSGVRRITRFDPSGFAVQVAGEVPDEFDETRYVEPKDRPHVSRSVPLAVAGVAEALEDAGLDTGSMSREELRGIGVIVGSGGGSQDFTEEQLPPLLHRAPEAVQRLHHSDQHDRDAGQRGVHAVRAARA